MLASPSPKTPPMHASNVLSTSSWRTTRARLAPSAIRTATSRARCADRASCRLATLAQAISRTKPTAPMRARKIILIGPPLKRWLNVITTASVFLFVSGNCCASCFAMPIISACACASVTPGARREKTVMFRASRRSEFWSGTSGCQMSALAGNFTPSGMTPTIVAGVPLMLTDGRAPPGRRRSAISTIHSRG